MKVRITKGVRDDGLEMLRDDGSIVHTRFPKKGPVPHDITHFIVERQLGLNDGFWGKVAGGAHPEELGAMAKSAGHASAKRARLPQFDIVEIIQSERIVEAFEAELWSGGEDNDAVRAMAQSGCEQSLVPGLAMADAVIDAARAALRDFRDRWSVLDTGGQVELSWSGGVEASS